MGTAGMHGELWGARARDWADVQEPSVAPVYEAVLRKLNVGPDSTLLDVGCGAGLFCALATQLGATIKGLDAAQGLIEIARERVPQGDFRVRETVREALIPFKTSSGSYELSNRFRYLIAISE